MSVNSDGLYCFTGFAFNSTGNFTGTSENQELDFLPYDRDGASLGDVTVSFIREATHSFLLHHTSSPTLKHDKLLTTLKG